MESMQAIAYSIVFYVVVGFCYAVVIDDVEKEGFTFAFAHGMFWPLFLVIWFIRMIFLAFKLMWEYLFSK